MLYQQGAVVVFALVAATTACKLGSQTWGGVEGITFQAQQVLDGRAADTYNWGFDPCGPSTLCPNAGLLQQKGVTDNLCHARWDKVTASTDTAASTVITLSGSGGDAPWTTQATVTITCDAATGSKIADANSGKVNVVTVAPNQFNFQFAFKSGCACGKGCSSGGAGGWIFVGLLLGGFFLYFVIGTIFNIKKRELKGVQAIPHVEFWKDLPFLTKDGCLFVFGRLCRNSSYSQVK
eukprot:TRINITY_DN10899_c0_g1_i1.p2 TRINITY_DN10899_c0_g1~~TRINITY_DN10899_c0_g1_i1.p2  ORF type:complete len:236 (-),score=49.11 TRINITY_DN10899_c0_g1_i1:49-756(-)